MQLHLPEILETTIPFALNKGRHKSAPPATPSAGVTSHQGSQQPDSATAQRSPRSPRRQRRRRHRRRGRAPEGGLGVVQPHVVGAREHWSRNPAACGVHRRSQSSPGNSQKQEGVYPRAALTLAPDDVKGETLQTPNT